MKRLRQDQWFVEQVATHLDIQLNDQQRSQFAQYFDYLRQVNQQINLTAITEEQEVYIKHFYDSLTIASIFSFQQGDSLIDIGTGAGFPGIPLKIIFPDVKITLLDSLKKRIHFLQEVIERLHLKQITCVHGRAEDMAHKKDYREQFDVVTARAVAKLNTLAEYCLPFVKVGGTFLAMKSPSVHEEINDAKQAFHKLGQVVYTTHSFSLPNQQGERVIVAIQKKHSTPKAFPRRAGIPKRKPL